MPGNSQQRVVQLNEHYHFTARSTYDRIDLVNPIRSQKTMSSPVRDKEEQAISEKLRRALHAHRNLRSAEGMLERAKRRLDCAVEGLPKSEIHMYVERTRNQ